MGIYDRDYYRDDDSGWGSTFSGRAVVWIVGVTVGVFVLQLLTRDGRTGTDAISTIAALDPTAILRGQVWRLVTAFFVSYPASLLSLAFALYFLYIMGDMVEGVYGRREFVAYYVAAGVVGSIGVMAAYFAFGDRVPVVPVYGIVAPAAAVLVLAACHFPQRRIMLMFVIPVPIWLLAAGMVGLNILGFVGSGGALHTAGTLTAVAFGLTYYWRQFRITPLFSGVRFQTRSRSPARLRIHPGSAGREVLSTPSSPPSHSLSDPRDESPAAADEYLEAKLDRVLEKVSRTGRDSLTPEENRLLLRASEIYKRRRGP